jgi:hypothetical protein
MSPKFPKSARNFMVVCLLDDNPSTLLAKDRFLSSAGWQMRPFT